MDLSRLISPMMLGPMVPLENYPLATQASVNMYQHQQHQQHQPHQQHQQHQPHQPHQHQQEPAPLQTQPQLNQQQHQPSQPQQPQPPPHTMPPLPLYPFASADQTIALLANPQVASSLYNFFNIMLQASLRNEAHHTHHTHHPPHHYNHHHPPHHYHHPPYHYHHHLHGSHHHHHHHHGPNGQNNGQEDTMLTISESKPRGLTRAEIDSLAPYTQHNEKDSRTCVICLSKFELKSKIRPLPCNHAFHAKCVDKWLRANRTCPICRRDALKTYGAKIKRI